MSTEAISYVKDLAKKGMNIAIFSCEDPYNTPFHLDLYKAVPHYLHFAPAAGSLVNPASIDLGLQAKHINAFGIFGHYGEVHGKQVCAAIYALSGDYSHFGPDLNKAVKKLSEKFSYQADKTIKENVESWTKQQYEEMKKLIEHKQKHNKGAIQGPIEVFAGLIENSPDAANYKAEVLWHDTIGGKL